MDNICILFVYYESILIFFYFSFFVMLPYPNLELYSFIISLYSFYFEVNSNCGNKGGGKAVIGISKISDYSRYSKLVIIGTRHVQWGIYLCRH